MIILKVQVNGPLLKGRREGGRGGGGGGGGGRGVVGVPGENLEQPVRKSVSYNIRL